MSQQQGRKLMHQVGDRIRIKHYARSTERIYVYWILRYIIFHGQRHPARMGKPEIEVFLNHLLTAALEDVTDPAYPHTRPASHITRFQSC